MLPKDYGYSMAKQVKQLMPIIKQAFLLLGGTDRCNSSYFEVQTIILGLVFESTTIGYFQLRNSGVQLYAVFVSASREYCRLGTNLFEYFSPPSR